MTEKGVTKTCLVNFKNTIGLGYSELASALRTTTTMFISKKGTAKSNQVLSVRIIIMAVVYSYGYFVFEDRESFNEWMSLPRRPLGGKTPLELMTTEFGRNEVINLLGRIEYRVYS